jgi:hypothetical protein
MIRQIQKRRANAQAELILPEAISPAAEAKLRRLRRLVKLMDQAIRIPGTRIRLGLDSLAGLAPVVGDVATAGVSLYLIDQARQLGADRPLLTRMLFNLAVDAGVGMFPLLGDFFDVAWKANVKNLRLLEEHLQTSSPGERNSIRSGTD